MLTKTDIEYLNWAWNFYTGCDHWKTGVCAVGENCWAKSMAERFHRSFEPTLHSKLLLDPLKLKKPARIGACFTGDLFGDWVDPTYWISLQEPTTIFSEGIFLKNAVFDVIEQCPDSQFFFLTKAPHNLRKWGKFPENALVGTSVCDNKGLDEAFMGLNATRADTHTWLSIEPLYERLAQCSAIDTNWVNWVVIGGQERPRKVMPEIAWVREIVEACDKAGIPVFLKDNLDPLLGQSPEFKKWVGKDGNGINLYRLRQEFPK